MRECAQDLCAQPLATASVRALAHVCVGTVRACADNACARGRAEQKPPDFTRAGDSANHIFPDKRKVPLTPSTSQFSHGQTSHGCCHLMQLMTLTPDPRSGLGMMTRWQHWPGVGDWPGPGPGPGPLHVSCMLHI